MHRKSLVFLIGGVVFLIVVGVVMLMSTSLFSAQASDADGYREAKRQALWLGVGAVACWWAATTDYRQWRHWVWWVFAGVALLLVLCFVPGIGLEVNGERRWIGYGPARMQPSELAKIALPMFIAYWFSRHPDCGKHVFKGFLAPLVIAGVMVALVLFEVDMGTTIVLCGMLFLLLFVAGVDWRYLTGLIGSGVVGFIGMLSYAPNRVDRIKALFDPEKYRLEEGFQQWISLMALGSGGLTGRGLGEGRLKMLYMPFAHTDFIFPMIGEELGLVCTVLVVIAFLCVCVAGFTIAFHAADRFGTLLAMGLTCSIVLQAFLNIGVAISLLPNTGLPLPFVSYGGSSLVFSLLAIGILINIYRQGQSVEEQNPDILADARITPRP